MSNHVQTQHVHRISSAATLVTVIANSFLFILDLSISSSHIILLLRSFAETFFGKSSKSKNMNHLDLFSTLALRITKKTWGKVLQVVMANGPHQKKWAERGSLFKAILYNQKHAS
jgi:hypothetical protein